MYVQPLLSDLGEKLTALETRLYAEPAERWAAVRAAWESLRAVALELRRRETLIVGPQRSGFASASTPGSRPARWTALDESLLGLPWPEGWLLRQALDGERPHLAPGTGLHAPRPTGDGGPDGIDSRLLQVVGALRPDQAEAVTLRFGLDGQAPRTFAQIGQALGICEGTARHRVRKALREIRRAERRRQLAAQTGGALPWNS